MRQIKTTTTTTTRTTTTARWATTAAALGIAGLASPGCQRYVYAPRGGVQYEPVAIDEAMQIRDWEPSSARYTNPRFIAGPVGYWFQPAYDMPEPVYAVQETPMFALQTLALPLTVWFPPLWTPIEYAGETLEPTWHAMPPQPEAPDGESPAPADVTERGLEEPAPAPAEPGVVPPAPYEEAPGQTVIPATQPTRGLEMERTAPATQPGAAAPASPRTMTTPAAGTPAPSRTTVTTPAATAQPTAAPAARSSSGVSTPATQPTYTPSSVAPARTTTVTTRPTTVPARDMNK